MAKRTLREFWQRHPRAETPLKVWYARAAKAAWRGPTDVKADFGPAVDFVGDNRVVFDIGGNKFRLVAHMIYRQGRMPIKFVGTYAEYDKVDAETV